MKTYKYSLPLAGWFTLLFLISTQSLAVDRDEDCISPALLGSETWPTLAALFKEQRAALAKSELQSAIEIQREVVKLQCHNHYQWYYLAELLLKTGDTKEAVVWLNKLYDRKVNDLEKRITTKGNPLFPLSIHPDYLSSSLAKKIEARKKLFKIRHEKFRQQLASLTDQEKPPKHYTASEVCPFECCSYREWGLRETVTLVDKPYSKDTISTASIGEKVKGLTGNVYLTPTPLAIVHPSQTYDPNRSIPRGEIIFLLDYMGEGSQHVWYKGTVVTMSTSGEVQTMCPFPDKDCWGEYLASEQEINQDHDWWVKVRLSDGTEGWTNNTHAFDNMDACG